MTAQDNQRTPNPSMIEAGGVSLQMSIAWAITTATRLQGHEIDRLRLHDAVIANKSAIDELAAYSVIDGVENDLQLMALWQKVLLTICGAAGIDGIEIHERPDPARLPALTYIPGAGWGLVRTLDAQNRWLVDFNGNVLTKDAGGALSCLRLVVRNEPKRDTDKPVFRLIRKTFFEQKNVFVEVAVATILLNLLALVTSLYSMQIYDRVIPTQGYATLAVLTFGVVIAFMFDIVVKSIRSHLMEHAVVRVDKILSREIFGRLLQVRMDQLPPSVGSLSAQMRGYETIRGFVSATSFYLLVDVPFGIFFIILIALIGSPIVAVVPLFAAVLAVAFGFVMRGKIELHAKQSTTANYKKTGLLVEAIEGAETIKSGVGGWHMLSKWIDATEEALAHEMSLKNLNEASTNFSILMQQFSYVGLVAVGAYLAAEGQITLGGLIACSILSGRVLSPVIQIPSLIVQSSHAKFALEMLEKVYALKIDNHGIDRPIIPAFLRGQFNLERVRFSYPDAPGGISIDSLTITPGEKVGVIGPIGAGKSTLLRLLSGLYCASEGNVLIDSLDINQVSRQFLGEKIGYLQQDHRLFSGSLRENLLIGIADPGDEVIKQAAELTGLLSTIIGHPQGLDMMIAEGGKGLSGGQKQLVALTRLLINKPSVWLLDEPTASMDNTAELRCFQVIRKVIKPENTLVLITHKPSVLALVDRLILVANHKIIMDGPRDEVMKKLSPS